MSSEKKNEFILIIKKMMKKISEDVIIQKQMPILDLPKVGYDNTVWSNEKRMLTIGDKKIEVSPDSIKRIPTFAQYLVMANAIKKLLDEDMESTYKRNGLCHS